MKNWKQYLLSVPILMLLISCGESTINSAPVLTPILDMSVVAGNTVTISPIAIDIDGDELTYTFSGWMSSNSYTTTDDDVGTHTVTVTVSDGTLIDSQVVTITVLAATQTGNRAPVLDPINDINVNAGDQVSFSPTASDPDGDTLTFSYNGWMTSNSHTTTDSDIGSHTVTVTVSDGALSDSQNVTVTVAAATASSITVSWQANSESDLEGYRLYHGNSSSALTDQYTIAKDSTSFEYPIQGGDGPDHYFAISAFDAAGNESPVSDTIHVNTTATK